MKNPSECWNCNKKGTMKLVKDSHNMTFYQCQDCLATDNGEEPVAQETTKKGK